MTAASSREIGACLVVGACLGGAFGRAQLFVKVGDWRLGVGFQGRAPAWIVAASAFHMRSNGGLRGTIGAAINTAAMTMARRGFAFTSLQADYAVP